MDVLREANAREAAGEGVLHLEVGQPGNPAPQAVRDAAKAVIDGGRIGYTDALGIPELRQAIARHYGTTYGVDLDPERVVVTTGSSGGFLLSFLAGFAPGARVALAAPGYPAYRNILKALDIEPILLETDVEHRFQPTPELLEALPAPPDGLIVASPSNPAGTMLGEAEMRRLTAYCEDAGVLLISDEIYHGISYAGRAVSALEHSDEAVIVNSFSKYFCMTGWRLGWMVLPERAVRPVERLAQNLFISAPAVSQAAGVAAFDCGEEYDRIVAGYRRSRDLLLERLPAAGFDKLAPADGAFYVYADVGRLTNDSPDFCRRMLQDINVATTPGVDFDPARGHRFLRFSFAGPYEDIAEAADRLGDWLSGSAASRSA
jgi:aspartate/methionine/tyrosine aminotransferase